MIYGIENLTLTIGRQPPATRSFKDTKITIRMRRLARSAVWIDVPYDLNTAVNMFENGEVGRRYACLYAFCQCYGSDC